MKLKKLSLCVALLTTLTACGQKSSEELLQSAANYMEQSKPSAAIIELKTAIQQSPQNAEARVALAKVYLQLGDGVSAAKEFNRAIEFGHAESDIAADRVRADYLAGVTPAQDIAKGLTAGSFSSDLVLVYQSMIAFEQGQFKDLDVAFTTASQSTYPDISALGTAYVAIMQKNLAKTVESLKKIQTDSPVYIDSVLLKARAFQALSDLPNAILSLKEYSEAIPQSNVAKMMLAEALVKNNQGDEAEPIIDDLLKRFPEQPMANYLKSTIEFGRKDFTKAKEHAEKAINNGFTSAFPRIVAAMSSIALDLNAQALNHLQAIKTELKDFPELEKAYAMLELQAGNIEVATGVFKNLSFSQDDLKLIASATAELSRQGAGQSARELLQHVEQNMDKNVQSLAALGMMKISVGNDAKGGIADLEAALAQDPSAQSTRFTLALAYLSSAKYHNLDQLTADWKKSKDTAAMAHTFDAYAFLQQNQIAAAITAADAALAADKNSILALMLKARVALKERKTEEAKKLVQQTLALKSDFAQALELSYLINRGTNGENELIYQLNELLNKAPERIDLRILIGKIYLDKKQYAEAIQLIKADKSKPENKPALLWQIELAALQQNNDLNALQAVADDWKKAQPNQPEASLAVIQAYITNKKLPQALSSLKELRQRFPEDPKLKGVEVFLQTELGDTKKALTAIATLPEDYQNNPSTLFLKARLLTAERDFKGAIASLRQSYQLSKLEPTTLALADLLARNESTQVAVQFLENHFSTEAKTPNLLGMYANLLSTLEPAKAEKNFLELIKADEEDLLALNNLAYLYTQQNNLAQAKIYADRAFAVNPNHPDVLDTLGVILLKQGLPQKALEQFQKSLKQRPNHPEVMLNLSEALIKIGDKKAAEKILANILSTNLDYQTRKQQLLQQL
jgi:cellulose synthase operon protein C